MKIRLKDETINLDGLHQSMLLALWTACHVWKAQGMETLTITSARDGQHMNGSLHYTGQAVDLRRWGIPAPQDAAITLAARLGHDYDVILEETHFHIEYDPKNGNCN